jgi:hypothetical protein
VTVEETTDGEGIEFDLEMVVELVFDGYEFTKTGNTTCFNCGVSCDRITCPKQLYNDWQVQSKQTTSQPPKLIIILSQLEQAFVKISCDES